MATFTASALAYTPIDSPQQRLWLRQLKLVVGDSTGQALDLSQLQSRFLCSNQTVQSPASLEARIYNLSKDTVKKIQKEFTRVQLSAGYQQGPFGVIFNGTICQLRIGKENATDSFLDIVAADGDVAYNQATVQAPLAAGWKREDVQKALVNSLPGVTQGFTPPLAQDQAPRGKVLFGMTRDHLRTFSNSNGVDWGLEGGKVNFVPWNSYIPGDAPVLTAATGMIGVPEQTIDGVAVRVLLNPNIKAGRTVQIANASISNTIWQRQFGLDTTRLPDLDRDSLYKVYSVRHLGDSRGAPWYTEAICAAITPEASGAGVPIVVSSKAFLEAPQPYINPVVSGHGQ